MLNRGLIVSIQGYSQITTEELIGEAIKGGAIAIRTDKEIKDVSVPIIILKKEKASNPCAEAYITSKLYFVKEIENKGDYIAIDYRECNKSLKEISDYCKNNNIKVIADIGTYQDYINIKKNNYYYTYIATTFSVFNDVKKYTPDVELLRRLILDGEKNIICEGNISTRTQLREVLSLGINNVCIGSAISNVFKLTKKFGSVF